VSLEVVSSWVKSCLEPKQLDKLAALIEQQRVVIREREAAKAAKQRGT